MDLDENLLATFGLIASSIIAIVANSLLLVVFCRRRGLRTVSNTFVINLLFANVFSSVLLLPTFILDSDLIDTKSPAIFTQSQYQQTNITANDDIIFAAQRDNTEIIQHSTKDITILEESQEEIFIDSPQQQLEVIESTINYTLTIRNQFDNNTIVCFLSEFVVTFACTACIFSVLLIGVDQYVAVLHPLRYQSYINKTRSVLLILLTWFASVLFGVGSALTGANMHYFTSCQSTCHYQATTWTITFATFYLIVAICTPFLTICDIYVCIYKAAHKNSARVRKVTSMNFPISTPITTLKKTHSAPNFTQYEAAAMATEATDANVQQHLADPLHHLKVKICRTSSDRLATSCRKELPLGGSRNIFGQIRHKLSNASVFRYREESRTAKISVLVIFMVLLCYGPYGISLMLNAMKICTSAIHRFNTISLVLLITSNVISPFLFAYRNRRIQREMAKFLRMIPQNSLRRMHRKPPPNIVIQRNSDGNPLSSSIINDNIGDNCRIEVANSGEATEPFLVSNSNCDNNRSVSNSNVINIETDLFETTPVHKKSILKRVCSGKSWNYKKCSFITVPDSCLDARGSFSSASTQVSTEEC